MTTLALLTLDTRGQTKIKFHNGGLVLLEPESHGKHISADELSVSSGLCRFQNLSYFVELYCQMISMRSNSLLPQLSVVGENMRHVTTPTSGLGLFSD